MLTLRNSKFPVCALNGTSYTQSFALIIPGFSGSGIIIAPSATIIVAELLVPEVISAKDTAIELQVKLPFS